MNYAIGGEVQISTSPGRTPEETVARARQIRAAALAPAEPSGQERRCHRGGCMEQKARMEMARETAEEGASGKH